MSDLAELQASFNFEDDGLDYTPSYNIAPTQQSLVVTNEGVRRCQSMRWGLIPFWAKDVKAGYRMINAAGETAAQKAAFRSAFRKRRCLVLADGFFEWRKEGKSRVPNYFLMADHKPLAFAGLWERWRSPDGEWVRSFTILTTEANALVEPVHGRMPAVLMDEAQALWLDPLTEDPDILGKLLTPAPAGEMQTYPVSSLVNSPKNDGPECIQRVETSLPEEPRLLH